MKQLLILKPHILRGYVHRIQTVFWFVLLWVATAFQLDAQTTLNGSLQLLPPYPAYLLDYTNTSAERAVLTLTSTNFEASSQRVRLKMLLEKGNSLMAYSSDAVIGEPTINLTPNIPVRLGTQLAPYFRLENLQGMSPDMYNRLLPEGMYRVTFEVYDYMTNTRMGSFSQQMWLVLNEPPQLNMPRNAENIQQTVNTAPINFQWLPRAVQSASLTDYEFTLVEILDDYGNPVQQFMSSAPKYTTTVQTTTLALNPLSVNGGLIAGRTYAWRVRAKARQGVTTIALYKNDGYSDIFTFKYNGACAVPTGLQAQAKAYDQINLTWSPSSVHSSYRVAYRKYSTSTNWDWVEQTTSNTFLNLTGLEASTQYEIKVGGVCGPQLVSFTPSVLATTLAAGQVNGVSCGTSPTINITNQALQPTLYINDVIMAGDFPVTLTQVTGSNGVFSGTGYVKVPWLADTKIKVTFNGIKVNTDKKLIGGVIETAYDSSWGNIASVDALQKDIKELVIDISNWINEGRTFLNRYQGSPSDQDEARKYQNDFNQYINGLINSPSYNNEEKASLAALQNKSNTAWNGLSTNGTCTCGSTNSGGGGPNGETYESSDIETNCCKVIQYEVLNELEKIANRRNEIIRGVTDLKIDNVAPPQNVTNQISFLTPANTVITLPIGGEVSVKNLEFISSFPEQKIPNGALVAFSIGNDSYIALYSADFTKFIGYCKSNQKESLYPDAQTKSLNSSSKIYIGYHIDDCLLQYKSSSVAQLGINIPTTTTYYAEGNIAKSGFPQSIFTNVGTPINDNSACLSTRSKTFIQNSKNVNAFEANKEQLLRIARILDRANKSDAYFQDICNSQVSIASRQYFGVVCLDAGFSGTYTPDNLTAYEKSLSNLVSLSEQVLLKIDQATTSAQIRELFQNMALWKVDSRKAILQSLDVTRRIKCLKLLATESLESDTWPWTNSAEVYAITLVREMRTEDFTQFLSKIEAENITNSSNQQVPLLSALCDEIGNHLFESNYKTFINVIHKIILNELTKGTLSSFASSKLNALFDVSTFDSKILHWGAQQNEGKIIQIKSVSYDRTTGEIVVIKQQRIANENFTNFKDRLLSDIQNFISAPTSTSLQTGNWNVNTTPQWETLPEQRFKPFDLVMFISNTNIENINDAVDIQQGQFVLVPAIFLKYASDEQNRDEVLRSAQVTLDVVSIFSGGYGLLKGGAKLTQAARAYLIFQTATAAIDLGIDIAELDRNTDTKGIVNLYRGAVMIFNLGDLTYNGLNKIPGLVRNTKAIWSNLSTNSKGALTEFIKRFQNLEAAIKSGQLSSNILSSKGYAKMRDLYNQLYIEFKNVPELATIFKKVGVTIDDVYFSIKKWATQGGINFDPLLIKPLTFTAISLVKFSKDGVVMTYDKFIEFITKNKGIMINECRGNTTVYDQIIHLTEEEFNIAAQIKDLTKMDERAIFRAIQEANWAKNEVTIITNMAKLENIQGLSKVETDIVYKHARSMIEESEILFSNSNKPGVGSILVNENKFETAFSVRSGTEDLPDNLHPLVDNWFRNPPLGTPVSKGFGKCGEPQAVSQWLRAYEKTTGIPVTTMEKAREVLAGTKSTAIETTVKNTVRDPITNKYKVCEIGDIKEACITCNPFLKAFNITEIKVKLNILKNGE